MLRIGCLLSILLTLRVEATTMCGVRFDTPQGWKATRATDTELKGCSVGLKPAGWDAQRRESETYVPEFAVFVSVSKRSVADVARVAGFERVGDVREDLQEQFRDLADDDWLVSGKARSKATAVRGKTWRGAIGEAVVWTGFKDGRGGHASTTEYRALLIEERGDGRTAYVWCEHPIRCEDVLAAFVESFQFSR